MLGVCRCICFNIHRLEGKYIFMQADMHECVCMFRQTCINLYIYAHMYITVKVLI